MWAMISAPDAEPLGYAPATGIDRWNGPPGDLGHFVPGVSKILRVRDKAQDDRFQNSGELRVYREAQTDIPDPLFIPDKSAWPKLLYGANGSSRLWG